MDRLFCVIVMSPFIATLMIPEIRYRNHEYELRTPIGLLAGSRLQLMKKSVFTETSLGICNDEDIVSLNISDLEVTSVTIDSTMAVVTSVGKKHKAVFYKRL